jgi:hypothetical protein
VERLDRDDGMAAIWKVVSRRAPPPCATSSAGSSYECTSFVVFVWYLAAPRGELILIFSLSIIAAGAQQYPTDERAPVPLSIHHTPLCVTFAYLEG